MWPIVAQDQNVNVLVFIWFLDFQ